MQVYFDIALLIENISKRSVYDRYPIKAVKVMHTVALRNETALSDGGTPANPGHAFQVFCYSSEGILNLLTGNHGR